MIIFSRVPISMHAKDKHPPVSAQTIITVFAICLHDGIGMTVDAVGLRVTFSLLLLLFFFLVANAIKLADNGMDLRHYSSVWRMNQ